MSEASPAGEARRQASERVVDASVVVAALAGGALGDRAAAMLPGALLSAVGLAEVAGFVAAYGAGGPDLEALLDTLGCEVVPFDAAAARATALLAGDGPAAGLPLGARAGLALGAARGLPVLTADRRWADRALGPGIRLVR